MGASEFNVVRVPGVDVCVVDAHGAPIIPHNGLSISWHKKTTMGAEFNADVFLCAPDAQKGIF